MSAVVAIRNAIQMLTTDEHDQISGLIENMKTKYRELKSEVSKRDRIAKTELNKRNTLLDKIRLIDPHFTYDEQSYDDLKTALENAKSQKALQIKEDKRRERLEKKWTDADFQGHCPDMDNDALEAHIKDLLKKQKDEKLAHKKAQSQLLAIENKRKKIFDKLVELGLKPTESSSFEDLQTLHTEYLNTQKLRKKEEAAVLKFRKLLDELISKNPDAGILNAPDGASAKTLEDAVKNARDKRDAFKKEIKELDKLKKAQERADKKHADDQKKSDAKAQKLADKEAGIKGTKKNGHFQAFSKYITQEIQDGNIDQSLIDDAGGKGKYNSKKWREMTESEKKDPTAPWNLISA